MRTCCDERPEDGNDEGGCQGGPLRQLDKAGDDGGDHEEEAEAGHPQVAQRTVHEHAGTLQRRLELDLGAADGVHSAPQGLHVCPPARQEKHGSQEQCLDDLKHFKH